jgi:hypothetical protein
MAFVKSRTLERHGREKKKRWISLVRREEERDWLLGL